MGKDKKSMKNYRCLILFPIDEEDKKRLEEKFPNLEITYSQPDEVSIREIGNADIVIGNPKVAQLKYAAKLQWLQLRSAGADEYASCPYLGEKVLLTNGRGAYGSRLAEYMLGGILALQKHFPAYWEHQKRREWKKEGLVRQIAGSVVLVLGVGDIGGTFAKYCKAMGAYVIGLRRQEGRPCDTVDEIYGIGSLDKLLPRADIVAMCLPNTPQTAGVIGERQLAFMKEGAILVNVGRGIAVDTPSLCAALERGKLYGAVLDVTEEEPLPADHPLWQYDNVILTPHIAGTFDQKEGFHNFYMIAEENISRFFEGKTLRNLVDRELLY